MALKKKGKIIEELWKGEAGKCGTDERGGSKGQEMGRLLGKERKGE